jgi:hypothetical protein
MESETREPPLPSSRVVVRRRIRLTYGDTNVWLDPSGGAASGTIARRVWPDTDPLPSSCYLTDTEELLMLPKVFQRVSNTEVPLETRATFEERALM